MIMFNFGINLKWEKIMIMITTDFDRKVIVIFYLLLGHAMECRGSCNQRYKRLFCQALQYTRISLAFMTSPKLDFIRMKLSTTQRNLYFPPPFYVITPVISTHSDSQQPKKPDNFGQIL